MKHWVLHFDDGKGKNECVREYPQLFFKKFEDVLNMIRKEREKGNPFFNKYFFNGKCVLVDLQKQKQELANLIGKLIYN